jgi:hypothetical protein
MKTFRTYSRSAITSCLSVAACALGLAATTAHAQSFVNGGFEADSWATGSNAGASPTGWVTTLSGDGSWPYGVHNDGNTTQEHTPFGNQFIELCAKDCRNSPPVGSISQTVSGFVIGQQYRLDFQHAPEVHSNAPAGFEESIVNVSITGGTPASTNFSGNAVGGYFAQWTAQSLVFTANATSLTFTFTGVDGVTDQSRTESGIDQVSVTALGAAPTPPTSSPAAVPALSFYGAVLAILGMLLVAGRYFWVSSRNR